MRMEFVADDTDSASQEGAELPSGQELVEEIERLLRGGLETEDP
jgi:hypothetical protein